MRPLAILFTAIFIISTSMLNACHQPIQIMGIPIKYGPAYIQANNHELDEWRNKVDTGKDAATQKVLDANKNITCIDFIREDLSESYRCFQYAIQTITGYNGFIGFPEQGNITIDLAKYFQQTPYPQKDNLIIYTKSEQNLIMQHFAVAVNRIWFKSKSGTYCQVFEHYPFDLMTAYGKVAWSFELKPEYQGMDNRKHLLQDIRIDTTKILLQQPEQMNQHLQAQQLIQRNQKIGAFALGFACGVTYMIFLIHLKNNR